VTQNERAEEANYQFQIANEVSIQHKVPNIIGRPEKIDAWCHHRMYDFLEPIYRNYVDGKWLTIGDSGADAFAYKQRGINDIVASSLSSTRLEALQQKGLLDDIEVKAINAENSGQADDSFDVVSCKEAYHHFPRAAVGFYELLRIAKSVVAYDEPNSDSRFYILDEIRTLAKRILRGQDSNTQKFEPAGNFIYRLSVPETIKMATALQLPMVSYKYCNNFFVYSLADKNQSAKFSWLLIKMGITAQTVLCKLRLMSWGRVIMFVFKESPNQKTIEDLQAAGFTNTILAANVSDSIVYGSKRLRIIRHFLVPTRLNLSSFNKQPTVLRENLSHPWLAWARKCRQIHKHFAPLIVRSRYSHV